MADFTLRVAVGVNPGRWLDPIDPSTGRPSRVNPREGFPHFRWRGRVATQISVIATVAGVEGPLDTALGGRLFSAWFSQAPFLPQPPPLAAPGRSSHQSFTPYYPGYYQLGFRRTDGGIELVNVDVDP